MQPWVDAMLCATVLVQGRVCEGGGVPLVRGGRGRRGQAAQSEGEHLPATLLMKEVCVGCLRLQDTAVLCPYQALTPSLLHSPLLQPSHTPSPTPHPVTSGTLVCLEGMLQWAALVPPHTSCADAATVSPTTAHGGWLPW